MAEVSINKRPSTSAKRKKSRVVSQKPKSFDEIMKNKASRSRIKRSIKQELLKRKKSDIGIQIYNSPYSYIYAEYLKNPKYTKVLRAIENRLTDLGISGRIHKLSRFKDLSELVKEDLRRGITTIVVIGDDELIKRAMAITSLANVVLGIIPIGEESKITPLLGIPEELGACNILAQRLIDCIDIGKINNKVFFSNLYIPGQRVPILCDRQYEIFSFGGDVFIYNLNLNIEDKSLPKVNARDGRLEIIVRPRQGLGDKILGRENIKNKSLFYGRDLQMKSSIAFQIVVDGKRKAYKEVQIRVLRKRLKLIVGKGRKI
ncbi:diacylglycerol kinase family protein [Patescibacteria group bacterium]